MKKKLSIIFFSMILVLLILPYLFIQTAQPHEFMGVMMLLFFVVNPITDIIVNLIIGKDIKKMWWLPITFSIVFLLSYWLVLQEIIFDLIIYALIYLVLGIVSMFISLCFKKKKR